MAWSIFTPPGTPKGAESYAASLLKYIGAPESRGNLQFVYDWELSEGGGGTNNPLNVGASSLSSSGTQYGGGAANYPSLAASIEAVGAELNTSTYSGIKSALKRKTDTAAERALFNSPWASSHYGYGSRWATTAVPGGNATLTGIITDLSPGAAIGKRVATAVTTAVSDVSSVNHFLSDLTKKTTWIRIGLVIFGAILVLVAVKGLIDQGKTEIDRAPGESVTAAAEASAEHHGGITQEAEEGAAVGAAA